MFVFFIIFLCLLIWACFPLFLSRSTSSSCCGQSHRLQFYHFFRGLVTASLFYINDCADSSAISFIAHPFNLFNFLILLHSIKMWEFNCTYVILITRFVFDSFSCVYNDRKERKKRKTRMRKREMFMFVFMLLLLLTQIIIKETRLKQQSRKIK